MSLNLRFLDIRKLFWISRHLSNMKCSISKSDSKCWFMRSVLFTCFPGWGRLFIGKFWAFGSDVLWNFMMPERVNFFSEFCFDSLTKLASIDPSFLCLWILCKIAFREGLRLDEELSPRFTFEKQDHYFIVIPVPSGHQSMWILK